MHYKESCYKVAKCIYHSLCITRNVAIKMRNVYIITCASQGRLVEGCGVCMSSHVHHKESCYKVTECIYHHMCITRKVVIKLQMYISSPVRHEESCYKTANVYIITCASQGKFVEGCGVYIS